MIDYGAFARRAVVATDEARRRGAYKNMSNTLILRHDRLMYNYGYTRVRLIKSVVM